MRLIRRQHGPGARRGRTDQGKRHGNDPETDHSQDAPPHASAGRATRRSLSLVGAVLAVLVVTTACARQWPAEPPEAHEWQLSTAPLNLVPLQKAGRVITAFAYAQQRPSPPSCDGLGLDDCEQYRGQYGRQLPARLDITCWDEDDDGTGDIDITLTPSRPILDQPGWHPRDWSGWGLDFDGDSGPKDVFVGAMGDGSLGLTDGFVAFVSEERLIGRALRYFSETAGGEDAQLRVIATFSERDGRTPLEWHFDLGVESMAQERIRHVVENCGRVW